MSLVAKNDLAGNGTIPLDLPGGGTVAVTLFAGGTTGLVLLDSTGEHTSLWAGLGEQVENEGVSALAFAGPIPGDSANAAVQAARLLERLGVEQSVIVSEGADAPAALRAAAAGSFAAAILIDPAVPDDELESLLAEAPLAKLVLLVDDDAMARAMSRHAIGPTVIRYLPRADRGERAHLLASEVAGLVAETILGFAIGVCGDGGRR
jgi:hypothetical protein